jgi:methylphosphotriester-DNA--protein-cysteine methyltransferase
MTVVTLKHLSREFDIDPAKLRRMFRRKHGLNPKRRWRWEEGEKTLTQVREWLKGETSSHRTISQQVQEETPLIQSKSGTDQDSRPSHGQKRSPPKKQSTSSSGKTNTNGSTIER